VNNWAKGLWPHAHHLDAPVLLAPGRSAFDYQFTAMGAELTLGTFCHENGHMLCDYPDLYDYGSESSGIGAYCLMCAGGNLSPKNPIPISAYLKRLSGWAHNVTALTHGAQVTLAAGSNDFAMYARSGREYFLIENRRKAGRDTALPDEGLAIWHIDEDGDNSSEQMTADSHYECSLEQADGQFDLERRRASPTPACPTASGGTAPRRTSASTRSPRPAPASASAVCWATSPCRRPRPCVVNHWRIARSPTTTLPASPTRSPWPSRRRSRASRWGSTSPIPIEAI
jgi:hypothetical protein